MSTRLKVLSEEIGAKKLEARKLIDAAQVAKRDLNSDELSKLNAIHAEIDGKQSQFHVEARQLAFEGEKGRSFSQSEERDIGKFDYGRFFRSMLPNSQERLEGIEREMVAEGEAEARASGAKYSGLTLPSALVRRGSYRSEKRDITATGTTTVTGDQGGMTIQTMKAGLLDDFYNASILRASGATVLEGLIGNLDVPRLVPGTASAGKTENATADEVNATTAMLTLTPKRLPGFIDIGEQLLKQSSSAIEEIVRRMLTGQMLATQEAAFFHGTGTNEAWGIAGTAGIGSVAGGTNGLAPAWAHIVGLESKVDAQNALLGNPRYFTNGKARAQLKTTQKAAGTDSRMILDDANGGLLNGYSPVFTNAIKSNLVKGASGAVCSGIFYGNPADYWIGYWGGLSFELLRDSTNAAQGLYRLMATAYYDGGVVRPKSFAAMLDALTPNA
jgi:HK97 family phage major capsid protein